MRKRGRFGSLPCATIALAMAATAATAGLVPALAIEFTTYELFEGPDSVDPKPEVVRRLADAMRKAQAPGNCPLGKLQMRTPEGDEIFQKAIADARRDAVLRALDRQGVKVAGRLFVESTVFGGSGGHDAAYQLARDEKPPQLKTESMPRKGSKVKAGDTIKVTMTARDDPTPWPTGLKTIQLVADSDGGRFIASENYEPCAEPRERRVVATYTVPANPPPIVRLTALAEDHVGLMDTDVGEFPTGDWYGRFEWTSVCDGPPGFGLKVRGVGDLTLDYDGRGNLTGTLAGTTPEGLPIAPKCSAKVLAPGAFGAKLVGSYTPGPGTMSARAVDVQITPGRVLVSCPFATHENPAPAYPGYETPMLPNAFRDLRREPDGSLKSKGERTVSVGASTCTTNYELTLRQARN